MVAELIERKLRHPPGQELGGASVGGAWHNTQKPLYRVIERDATLVHKMAEDGIPEDQDNGESARRDIYSGDDADIVASSRVVNLGQERRDTGGRDIGARHAMSLISAIPRKGGAVHGQANRWCEC